MPWKLHDYKRKLRVWAREARYSRIIAGKQRNALIRDQLVHLYRVANRFLYDSSVEYWLVYGTLLGYYRHGDLIQGDRDLDFGAHEQVYKTIWDARGRLPDGFTMHDTSHRHFGPKLYIAWKGWEADLYFYRDHGEQLQSYEKSRNIGDMQPFPRGYVYPIQTAAFLGEPTCIPCNPLAYLRHTYHYIGEDGVRDPETGYWHENKGEV